MSKKYTVADANQVTIMMKFLAQLEKDHPILDSHTKTATDDLIYIRDFIVDMLERQEE